MPGDGSPARVWLDKKLVVPEADGDTEKLTRRDGDGEVPE